MLKSAKVWIIRITDQQNFSKTFFKKRLESKFSQFWTRIQFRNFLKWFFGGSKCCSFLGRASPGWNRMSESCLNCLGSGTFFIGRRRGGGRRTAEELYYCANAIWRVAILQSHLEAKHCDHLNSLLTLLCLKPKCFTIETTKISNNDRWGSVWPAVQYGRKFLKSRISRKIFLALFRNIFFQKE